ncbi:hypothetical protein QJS10_CPA06g02265 [Acorus calamus]|uniref:AAA+ ATPase domain-containing protein n=1 Tax=Acorus calamus TaxID=4465 RepID=A0AAV9ELF7_ACOCL|nr:hypothetical protein QJS10_CPA06g02265 [Acorus calamus]
MEILSQVWSFLGLLTVLQNILPTQLLSLLHSLWQSLHDSLTPYSHFDVPEFTSSLLSNPLYRHVSIHLTSLLHHHPHHLHPHLSLSLPPNSSSLSLSLSPNHSFPDLFLGHSLLWTHHVDTLPDSLEERRSFSLRLPKRLPLPLLPAYLSHVSASAAHFERNSRDRLLFTNNTASAWASVPFRHPSTFDTLALEPSLKGEILSDLARFVEGSEMYRRIGRPWKRGYLLYGPPGSGKSSLIAAIANHLKYDVYDLELTKVLDNSELRSLLLQTTNRVTLSGLLNFTDGLWSCCGEERIVVFTTNYKDGIDPALLRPGRMDVHVRLGTCGTHALRVMARNYLGEEAIEAEHVRRALEVAEGCVSAGGALTPAEVGEVLMRNGGDAGEAMKALIKALQASILGGEGGSLSSSSDGSWDGLPREREGEGKGREKRRSWERRVKFLVRLRSLAKCDSGR